MSHISSINFKKSNPIQTRHNDRDLPPNYLIGSDCEVNRTHKEALELRNKIVTQAMQDYTQHTGQKFQAKSYEWSAVCNIKDSTTMQELEKLTEHFLKKYGFQCYQIAIHRDEGHINEQGEKVINHHAHLEFITLDKETGKNNYNRQKVSPSVLRQIQDEVAEILQMKRGQDKRLSGVKRIEPRKYAQMKEAEKRERQKLTQELCQEKTKNRDLQAELTSTKKELESAKTEFLSQKEAENYTKRFKKILANKGFEKPCFDEINALQCEIKAKNRIFTEQEIKKELIGIFFKHRKGRIQRIQAKKVESQNIQEPTTSNKELEAIKEILNVNIQELPLVPKNTFENYCKGQYFENNKEKDKTYLQGFLIENTKPYIQQSNTIESQKLKIDSLESKLSDLSAKNQKNDETYQKENKNDFRAISELLNDNFFTKIMTRLKDSVSILKNDAPMKMLINALYNHLKTPSDTTKKMLENATQEVEKIGLKKEQEQKTKVQKNEAFHKMQDKGLSR